MTAPLAEVPDREPGKERTTGGAHAVDPRVLAGVVGAALLAAVLFRVLLVVKAGFPVGDGGLFAAMTDAVRAAAPALPRTLAFNHHEIPFAYPPAGFALAALVGKLTGSDSVTVLWLLPLVLDLLALAAVCLLARRLLRDDVEFLGGVLLFLALPRSYEWLVMGGGLTRSPGLLFTALALIAADREGRTPGPRGPRALATGLCLAGVTLSHPEWTVAAAVAVILRVATAMPPGRALRFLARAGAVAAVVVAPWAATVLARHGVSPFLAASATSQHSAAIVPMILNLWFLQLQWVEWAPGILVVLGSFVLFARREPFLALWLPLIFVTTPRSAPNPAAIPYAFLASVGGAFVVRRALARWSKAPPLLALVPAAAFAVGIFVYQVKTPLPTTRALTPEQRACMEFVRRATPPDARFFVVSDALWWSVDYVAEWFPYLAARESLTTAQGLEWVGGGAFAERILTIERLNRVKRLQLSGTSGPVLGTNLRGSGTGRDWAMVAMAGATPSWGGFAASGRWRAVWAAKDVVLFQEVRVP